MTAAVESLHQSYPGEYLTGVQTTCPEIWANNPRISTDIHAYESEIIALGYPLINQSDRIPAHFMDAFCRDLSDKLGIPVPLMVNKPSLYLSEAEKDPFPGIAKPYFVVNAGYKTDFSNKFAGTECYQRVVNAFLGRITFVQVGEKNPSHIHKPLENVVNMIGKTNTRDLIRLAYHSVGGIGPVSLLHHIYAAFSKPYVCYLGGREPLVWEYYSSATMLTTIGQLDCCRVGGCWKSRTVKLNDNTRNDSSICVLPMADEVGEIIPGCMKLLGSAPAIDAIERILEYVK